MTDDINGKFSEYMKEERINFIQKLFTALEITRKLREVLDKI